MNETNQIVAVLLIRVFFGVLMLMQGYDKLFRVGPKHVLETVEYPLKSIHGIPRFLVVAGVYFTTYVEFFGGLFLIFGFLKHFCLYLMAIDLLVATISFSVISPMWDMKHLFPRFILLVALLMIPSQWDVIALDYYLTVINVIK